MVSSCSAMGFWNVLDSSWGPGAWSTHVNEQSFPVDAPPNVMWTTYGKSVRTTTVWRRSPANYDAVALSKLYQSAANWLCTFPRWNELEILNLQSGGTKPPASWTSRLRRPAQLKQLFQSLHFWINNISDFRIQLKKNILTLINFT